ncbi:MAG: hypothetical protein ACI4CT_07370 [Lachnospiraceae bacterium]
MDYQKKIADELHELNGYMKKIVKSLDKQWKEENKNHEELYSDLQDSEIPGSGNGL